MHIHKNTYMNIDIDVLYELDEFSKEHSYEQLDKNSYELDEHSSEYSCQDLFEHPYTNL